MKKTIIILMLFAFKFSSAQTEPIVVQTGPGAKRALKPVLIINGFVIADTSRSNFILHNYSHAITKKKFYPPEKALERWGIQSEDGVLFYRLRKNTVIDIEKFEKR